MLTHTLHNRVTDCQQRVAEAAGLKGSLLQQDQRAPGGSQVARGQEPVEELGLA